MAEINANNVTLVQLLEDYESLKININHFFLIVVSAIIFFMQAGFALLEAGTVRAKNVTSILTKNISDMLIGGLTFWLCGYGFAFGTGNGVLGLEHFAAIGLEKSGYSFLFFQSTFAATCATIISGAIAERSHFNGYVVFSALITGVIYPIQTHWCWGPGGWLGENGYYDFAGSGVVHLAGATCALVACWIMGPRIGRFTHGKLRDIPANNIPLVATGFFILVFGFLAFNGGSQASMNRPGDGESVAMVFYATLIACCSGGAIVLIAFRLKTGYWKFGPTVNGALTGMVSVCCGCDGFYPWSACLAGAVGGLIYIVIAQLVIKLKIDDPIEAVAVHGGGGAWGLIAGPLLREDGVLSSSASAGTQMLLWNLIGMACIIAWNGLTSFVLFGTLHKLGVLRVNEECELKGLDLFKHDDLAYPEWTPKSLPGRPLSSESDSSTLVQDMGRLVPKDELLFRTRRKVNQNPGAVTVVHGAPANEEAHPPTNRY
ncbi:putative ammonium transporter 1 [Tigriopus californicus]|uniref:putative ammonium transporter 1 n=1 Tax=Tigriopus californicus TaxID=6832 RepID=UPI0027D9EE81|nr:putative ammonium transporter 1 [Tigriopus californicus]